MFRDRDDHDPDDDDDHDHDSVVEAPSLEGTIDFGGWLGGHF